MYSPTFISPSVIYARPTDSTYATSAFAMRASHSRGIEGFRSITRDAYLHALHTRSCLLDPPAKKSLFAEMSRGDSFQRIFSPSFAGTSRGGGYTSKSADGNTIRGGMRVFFGVTCLVWLVFMEGKDYYLRRSLRTLGEVDTWREGDPRPWREVRSLMELLDTLSASYIRSWKARK